MNNGSPSQKVSPQRKLAQHHLGSGAALATEGIARRLVLVDDSEDDIALIVSALLKIDYRIDRDSYADGREALDHLTEGLTCIPDLLITDLQMPHLDGAELIRSLRLRDGFRDVPMVVFSSNADPNQIERCYRAGCTTYVQKPNAFEDFGRAVLAITSLWLRYASPREHPSGGQSIRHYSPAE